MALLAYCNTVFCGKLDSYEVLFGPAGIFLVYSTFFCKRIWAILSLAEMVTENDI